MRPNAISTEAITLGANIIALPTADAILEMVTLDGPVWLWATGFPAGQPVTLTLTAPDGTSCTIPPDQLQTSRAATEAFPTPGGCAAVEGVWTAIFST